MATEIGRIYLSNKTSATLIIPKKIAYRNRLDKPDYVVIQDIGNGNGILIKRLEFEGEELT